MLAARKRPPLLVAIAVTLLVFFYHRDANTIYLNWASRMEAYADKVPANSTLGFGAIIVVSKEGSERRHGLLQAANVTDISLTIPTQPAWSEEQLEEFRGGEGHGVQVGSILAWLGHRVALTWFLDSGLETALILEDDVDWDIHLRTVQAPLAASAVRSLLPPSKAASPFSPFARSQGNRVQYWGDHASWDLLYLGHCGDYFGPIKHDQIPSDRDVDLRDVPHALYNDSTLPSKEDLHPFTRKLFDGLKVNDHQRVLHRSKFPLCSFGYALTRPAALRLLNKLAPPKLLPKGPRAFDVALLHACLKGSGKSSQGPQNPGLHPHTALQQEYTNPGLRCWTLNPELFHHMPGQSLIAKVGESVGEVSGIPPVDMAGAEQVLERNETSNIGCGFWGGAFAFDDDNKDQLKYLQKHVGREGKCIKYGRDPSW